MRLHILFILLVHGVYQVEADTLQRTSSIIPEETLIHDLTTVQPGKGAVTAITYYNLTVSMTTGTKRRKAQPERNKETAVMTFKEYMSSGLPLHLCLKVNVPTDDPSENLKAAIICVLFSITRESFLRCINEKQVDTSDRSLNGVILVFNRFSCTSKQRHLKFAVICASLYTAVDLSGSPYPHHVKICLLPYMNAAEMENKTQEMLKTMARDVCGLSFDSGSWHLTVASSLHQCPSTDNSDIFPKNETTEMTQPKILTYTSVVMDLLCVSILWREAYNKNKMMTLFLVSSVADIFSLAAIMIRFHLQDHRLAGVPCLVSAWMNYCGTNANVLVHMQITFNRFVAVVYPMKAREWCSWKKNIWALAIFSCLSVIVSIATCIPQFLGGIYESHCSTVFLKLNIWAIASALLYFICLVCVPVLLVFVLSVCVAIELFRVNRKRRELSDNIQELPSIRINLGLLTTVILFLMSIVPLSIIEVMNSFFVSFLMDKLVILNILLYLRCSTGCLNIVTRLLLVKEFRATFTEILKAIGRKLRINTD